MVTESLDVRPHVGAVGRHSLLLAGAGARLLRAAVAAGLLWLAVAWVVA